MDSKLNTEIVTRIQISDSWAIEDNMKDFQMKEMGDLLSEIIVECQDLCEDIGCVHLVVTQLCWVTLV